MSSVPASALALSRGATATPTSLLACNNSDVPETAACGIGEFWQAEAACLCRVAVPAETLPIRDGRCGGLDRIRLSVVLGPRLDATRGEGRVERSCLGDIFQSEARLVQAPIDGGPAEIDAGGLGAEGERRGVIVDSVSIAVKHDHGLGTIAVSLAVAAVQRDGAAKVADGAGRPLQRCLSLAAAVERRGVLRQQGHGLAELGNGFGMFTEQKQRVTAVVVSGAIARGEGDGLVEIFLGLVVELQLEQHVAAIVVERWLCGRELQRGIEIADGGAEVVEPPAREAAIVEREHPRWLGKGRRSKRLGQQTVGFTVLAADESSAPLARLEGGVTGFGSVDHELDCR